MTAEDAEQDESLLNDEDEVTENLEDEETASEETEEEAETSSEEETQTEEESDSDQILIELGQNDEDSPPSGKDNSAWVKLRQENRKLKSEIKEFQERSSAPQAQGLRQKPTLESHDYDNEKFERDLDQWYQEKATQDIRDRELKQQREKEEQAWQQRLDAFDEKKAKFSVHDFAEAEYVVDNTLSDIQRGMILEAADDPVLVTYALGKNPKRAKELAKISNHALFLKEIIKLEIKNLKVTNRKAAKPEKAISKGSGSTSSSNSTLEKLRKDAESTGDYSKVYAYKRTLRASK